jgi:glycosyltransferase involved in cell wall biosynthesis
MATTLALDFTGSETMARAAIDRALGRNDASLLAPSALLERLLNGERPRDVSRIVLVGASKEAIGYGLVPILALGLRPRTITRLDPKSGELSSMLLTKFIATTGPFALLQLFNSGLAVGAQRLLAHPRRLRTSTTRRSGERLRRLLYLRPSAGIPASVGGSVSHAHGTLDALVDLGVAVDAVTNDAAIAATAISDARFGNWNVVHAPRTMKAVPASAAAAADLALFKRARQLAQDCDVVYQRHGRFALVGGLVARAARRPLFLEFNSPAELNHPRATTLQRQRARCEDAVVASATRVFVVSAIAKDMLIERGVSAERVVVNPNGVEIERFAVGGLGHDVRLRLELAPDAVVFGFAGSFIAFHGATVLAKAFVELSRDTPQARLLLIGDGDERPTVAEITRELAATGRVRMTGVVSPREMPGYLAACDVLVSPHVPFADGTPFFGSPTKLFEYMAAGRAIVASRLGQIEDVLDHERTALLVAPGDVAGLTAALRRLAHDVKLRSRLGAAAREEAPRYTWHANARRVLETFEDLPVASG